MEENQNTNQQEQPKELIPTEAQEHSEPITPETSLPASEEVKEAIPTLLSQSQPQPQPQHQPQTTDIEPQIAPMEVHKHPHHVMHKKKWSEYLLEFFMLFLAVFLGFVAENIREHSVNKEIEKHNIESFVSNLKEDSVALIQSIETNRSRLVFLDSLLILKSSNLPEADFRKHFIYYMLKLGYLNYFRSNGSTFEQMRSSGTLRLLSHHVLDSVLKYQTLYSNIRQQGEICIMWWNKSIEKISETIDLVPLSKLGTNPLFDVTYQKLEAIQLPQFPTEENVLKSYYNWRMNERIAQAYYNEKLNEQLQYLKVILPFLKNHYHLQ